MVIMDYHMPLAVHSMTMYAFPRHYILKEGDLLKVDMVLGGPIAKSDLNVSKLSTQQRWADEKIYSKTLRAAWLILVGHTLLANRQKKFMDVTKEASHISIKKLLSNRGDIGLPFRNMLRSRGYSVVRDLVGHGVGPSLFELWFPSGVARSWRFASWRNGLDYWTMIGHGWLGIDTKTWKPDWATKLSTVVYHVSMNQFVVQGWTCNLDRPRWRRTY